MGPSVKFVSAIIGALSNKKKWGSIFFTEKRSNGGGGPEGGLAKDHTFSGFFFRLPSLSFWTNKIMHIPELQNVRDIGDISV